VKGSARKSFAVREKAVFDLFDRTLEHAAELGVNVKLRYGKAARDFDVRKHLSLKPVVMGDVSKNE